jgi:ABC-type antimicrobial peptide transport system ATPase subunit
MAAAEEERDPEMQMQRTALPKREQRVADCYQQSVTCYSKKIVATLKIMGLPNHATSEPHSCSETQDLRAAFSILELFFSCGF